MASQLLQSIPIGVDEAFGTAKRLKFTNEGEMFSGNAYILCKASLPTCSRSFKIKALKSAKVSQVNVCVDWEVFNGSADLQDPVWSGDLQLENAVADVASCSVCMHTTQVW